MRKFTSKCPIHSLQISIAESELFYLKHKQLPGSESKSSLHIEKDLYLRSSLASSSKKLILSSSPETISEQCSSK